MSEESLWERLHGPVWDVGIGAIKLLGLAALGTIAWRIWHWLRTARSLDWNLESLLGLHPRTDMAGLQRIIDWIVRWPVEAVIFAAVCVTVSAMFFVAGRSEAAYRRRKPLA